MGLDLVVRSFGKDVIYQLDFEFGVFLVVNCLLYVKTRNQALDAKFGDEFFFVGCSRFLIKVTVIALFWIGIEY